jgi:hypothetical protein
MRYQVDIRNIELGIQLLGNIYLVADIIPPGGHFVPLLLLHSIFITYFTYTFSFVMTSVLPGLALSFTF